MACDTCIEQYGSGIWPYKFLHKEVCYVVAKDARAFTADVLLSEHGVFDKPVEYLCDIAHTQARFLGLIGENENAWEVKDWRERIETFVTANNGKL
jgi:hypothetical protein